MGKWLVLGVFAIFIVTFNIGLVDDTTASLSLFAVVIVLPTLVGWRAWRIGQRIQARASEFSLLADKRGYDIGGNTPYRTDLFRLDEQRDARFLNTLQGNKWRYGDFTYNIYRKTKNGEYKAVEVYYSMLELDLPRKLPHLFFDAPDARGLQFIPHLDKSQKTSLEGDFDKHFVTYFPHHYHIDARSIISPEVMAAMIDSGVADIEISGDKLYMYSALMPVADIPKFVADGQEIQKKLSDHVVHYRDEKLFDSSNRKDVAIFGESLRKRPRFPWGLLVCVIVLALLPFIVRQMGGEADIVFEYAAYMSIFIFSLVYEAYNKWWKVKQANAAMEQSYLSKIAAHRQRTS